jgi:hypothetical protein
MCLCRPGCGEPNLGGMNIRTVSRVVGASALVLGPLALALPISVTDAVQGSAAEQLADYAANQGAALVSNLLLFPLMLLVPAMIYAARAAWRRAPVLAYVGGGLSALGWMAGLISIGAGQIALYQGARLPDRAGAAALIDAMNGDPVYGALVGIFVIGHIVGMIVLGVALWRSHAVARWAAGCYVAYPVLHFLGGVIHPVLDRASTLLLLAGSVMLAITVTQTADVPRERQRAAVAP